MGQLPGGGRPEECLFFLFELSTSGHGAEVFFFVSMCVCVCRTRGFQITFKKKVFISNGASNHFIDEG